MQINESTGLVCLYGPASVVMTCWFQDIKLTVVLSGKPYTRYGDVVLEN